MGEEVVVYLNQHSLLVAHDRSTGELVWSRELGGINGWLHVFDQTVFVGGWRGYTSIRALSLSDGSDRWVLPDGVPEFTTTQIHGESRSLIGVAPTVGQELWLFDLDSGQRKRQTAVPGGMAVTYSDTEPAVPTRRGPVILGTGNGAFLVIDGSPPSVDRVDIPDGVWSTNPAVCAGLVAFTTPTGELRAWWAGSRRLRDLGTIDHGPRNHLPIAYLGGDRFIVGTSYGLAKVVSDGGSVLAQRKIGKRVSTPMTLTSGMVVVGTASGEVLGLRIRSSMGTSG